MLFFFFFSSRRRHTRSLRDWSSDVCSSDLRASGIPLTGWSRRIALAWSLQSPELARAETDGLLLLWRRDVRERLERLAPFATFDAPTPVVAGDLLCWVAFGYLAAETFPLARRMEWDG